MRRPRKRALRRARREAGRESGMPVCLGGGVAALRTAEAAVRDGFALVAVGRAVLHERVRVHGARGAAPRQGAQRRARRQGRAQPPPRAHASAPRQQPAHGHLAAHLALAAHLRRRRAGGGVDTIVRSLSVTDGKPQAVLKGHKGLVLSLGYSPDGLLLASGERHGPIKLWSTTDGALKTTLPGHSGGQLGFSVHSLEFSTDGKRLASAGRDKKVRLWQVPD